MNMKKTIAAIAAGSVAVSAMATTVSALDAKTLTYSLVQHIRQNDAKGVLTATFPNLPLEAGGRVDIKIKNFSSWSGIATITGYYLDDAAGSNSPIDTLVCTNMDWEANYSKYGSSFIAGDTISLPVGFVNSGKPLAESSRATITVTVDYRNLDASTGYVGSLSGAIKDQTRGVGLTVKGSDDTTSGTPGTPAEDAKPAGIVNTDSGAVVRNEATLDTKVGHNADGSPKSVSLDYITTAAVQALVTAKDSGGSNKVAITANALDGWYTGVTAQDLADAINAKSDYGAAAAAAGEAVTEAQAVGTPEDLTEYGIAGATPGTFIDLVASTPAKPATGGTTGVLGTVNEAKILWESTLSGTRPEFWGNATEASGGTAKEIPYRSSLKNTLWNYVDYSTNTVFGPAGSDGVTVSKANLNNNAVGGGDVFYKIGLAAADNADIVVTGGTVDNYTYVDQSSFARSNAQTAAYMDSSAKMIAQNVRAVVNDAIQNYSDVTFIFNSATKNVKVWTNNVGTVTDYEYTTDGATAVREIDGNHSNDMKQIIDYTTFGRHFWDRDTGYDANTIYINNDWLGNNLFEGALVINSNLTLSLGATDKFDWTSTSLSFSWDAIQDTALTTNQYANYIQTMVLRTSSDWYWDNMQVVLGATDDEDVGTTSPVEAEEEELETEEPEVEVEPVEEPEVPAEPELEPEPVAAPNPGTGNAPVALAVIPVALAAAAIVAKKRG